MYFIMAIMSKEEIALLLYSSASQYLYCATHINMILSSNPPNVAT